MRIVSVLPSATEIVAALGHSRDLVGRSAECDFPPEIRDRAIVMRPRVNDFERSSSEIDARVRDSRGQGESLYFLDLPALSALQPDVLITQDLCGVCSVTGPEVEAACRAAGVSPTILSLTPRTLSEVWSSIDQVAAAVGDPGAGERLRHEVERRSAATPPVHPVARVALIEWIEPPILAGLWASEMIEHAGGVSVGPPSGEPGTRTTWAELDALRPDLVLLSPCSFSVDRTRRELANAPPGADFDRLHPRFGIYLADEAYFSRPGPRLADGVELIRAILRGTPLPRPMPVRRWEGAEGRAR